MHQSVLAELTLRLHHPPQSIRSAGILHPQRAELPHRPSVLGQGERKQRLKELADYRFDLPPGGTPPRRRFYAIDHHVMGASLKKQRLLVASGFLIVAVGYAAQTLVEATARQATSSGDYENFFGGAFAVGFALVGLAAWVWFSSLERLPGDSGMTRVLRLFAVANLIFAIGLVSATYFWTHRAIVYPYDGRTSIGIPTAYGLQLFGFCDVSVAFWSAGSMLRARG
jgi:F0F1-type ATP synthase membrane subunit c/vacuolar-type H+-ATPase subunit K